MTELDLFRAYGVDPAAPTYEVERAFPLPIKSGILGAVGCGGTKFDIVRDAGSRATTPVVGVSRLEVVAP